MIYAIGMKGWVELRRASKKPKPLSTELLHNQFLLKQTVYSGGKVLGSLPSKLAVRHFGNLQDGEIQTVDKVLFDRLKPHLLT